MPLCVSFDLGLHWMHVQVFESHPQLCKPAHRICQHRPPRLRTYGLKICWAEVEEVFAKMNARSKAPAPCRKATVKDHRAGPQAVADL
jgi:hypothetical protein